MKVDNKEKLSRKAENLLRALRATGGEMSLHAAETEHPDGLKELLVKDLIVASLKRAVEADGKEWFQPTIKLAENVSL